MWKDTWIPYSYEIESELIPSFTIHSLKWIHDFNGEISLPMRWSTLIDIDNDGIDEIFLWWAAGQNDSIYAFRNDTFIDVSNEYNISKSEHENTLAGVSADIDANWYTDLIISRDDSVTLYLNNKGVLRSKEINTWLADDTSPLWISLWDIDNDNDLDMFISGYIKRELMNGLTNFQKGYGWTSALLINDGTGNFENISKQAWLEYTHNTFQWIFIDLDNDSWLDLVVAHDTGEPRIYRNNEDWTFELKNNPYSWKFSYPMGIAQWDYNNDGLTDIMFSNIWTTLPKALVKWNLESTDNLELWWFLLKNEWDFIFSDVSQQVGIKDYEFSWGAVFADMNNDSLQDLIVAENFIELPFHKLFPLPWRFLLQNSQWKFVASGKESWVTNKHYAVTPLISDFNADWALDLVWVNIWWESFAYIQNNNVRGNYIQVKMSETAQNIWAKVTVNISSWKVLVRDYVIGEWLAADQSNIIHFGVWNAQEVTSLEIDYLSKESYFLENPPINTIINVN